MVGGVWKDGESRVGGRKEEDKGLSEREGKGRADMTMRQQLKRADVMGWKSEEGGGSGV